MSATNNITLVGNLGADPELHTFDSGNAKLRMRLATNEKWKDQNGEQQERTDWHTVEMWGKRAEALAKFLRKGFKVAVIGSLHHDKAEDREGNIRYWTYVKARDLEIVKGDGQPGQNRGDFGGGDRVKRDHRDDFGGADFGDDDMGGVPF
jgi:single-strand DNA-binding protein